MRTDKQLFKIFEAVPEWLFQLAGLPSPGRSTLQSCTVKALERVADGVVVPEAADQPLTIVEFQFQKLVGTTPEAQAEEGDRSHALGRTA